jgi:glycosyltransferase involved in cell wall biosynthesis
VTDILERHLRLPKISILLPVYNEADFVAAVVNRVLAVDFGAGIQTEVVAVDDGSSDGSTETLEDLAGRYPDRLRLLKHKTNRGKGAAIRTAIEHATGDIAVIQDSDLEYNPDDLPSVLRPLLLGHADAVFGSRFAAAGERRVLYFWHSLANHILTTLCNAVADLNLTDMSTGYKAFRLSLIRSIPLRSERFGIEPELTIKLAQRGASLYEVPVTYRGRTYADGKKIRRRDGLWALLTILNYSVRRDVYLDGGARILDALGQTPRFNAWMADTVRPFVGSNVLEIGAGIGNLTAALCRRRASYWATDLDDEHLARMAVRFQGRPNVLLGKCDLSAEADFAQFEGSFDTIVCLNVLEHIGDDEVGLRNISRALASGGRAIVLVPHDQSIYGSLDEVLGHYRRYSEAELRSRMEQAGFEVEQELRFNRVTRPGWYANGRLLKRKRFSRVQLWFFDHLVWLWRRLDRLLPWAPISLIAIGRKRTPA